MSSIDFTVLSAAMNKIILPAVQSQMYRRAPAWQLFGGWNAEEQVATRANVHVDRFENNKMYIPVRTGIHSGIVGIGIGSKYNYGKPKLNETYSEIRTLVGSFTVPKQVLNVKDAGAVVKPLMFLSDTLSRDLAMDANRQVYGAGTGAVATTASSGSSATTVTLKPSTNGDIDYSRYLPEGTRISIGDNAVTTVASVTGDNTITIADAQSWDADDVIYKVDGDGEHSEELDGFATMIAASGAYQNLDPASANAWKSYVDSTSETVTEVNIRAKLHNAYFKANKTGKVDWIVMNAKAFQIYGASLEERLRATQKEVLSGGWIGLDYMGGNAKVLLDYDCPDSEIKLLSGEDLVFGEFQPLEFEKGTDGNLFKIAQQLDYEVTASWMGNIGTVARNAQAGLSGKTFALPS